ncbi:hypothetical protein A5904_04815 [Acidithiobacillus caldus]|uniref:DUF6671 domain-containing protein n=1 Tax=Acidithiobacillus caldus TaxID=33059 RepID=A0A1E7YQB5_9PROT|nr:DUF6671 family protein [Acidithiobacillus caldus]AUW32384.1 hypothetical protein A5904_04815 [Acidithiobacillus caldus]MBU2782240.1 hypothetical protein [Acidithiobacillus caldus]MBU2790197.1 hypothetical protein [Acidithiobacillus caldus]MBU2803092.1 hypothetical protein [Acidithiobacillus caldus]MBU2822034.1 hypothetical protein [Acidithiobacillus caldus]
MRHDRRVTPAPLNDYYKEKTISLLTKHRKESIIAPILSSAGCRIELISQFDTDTLGTFTREIPRVADQLETARRKARIGMEISGCALGLASEGSFGSDPFIGLMPWNREVVVLVDDIIGIEIIGMAEEAGTHHHLAASRWEEASDFANRVGFPDQYLTLRPNNQNDPRIIKDITSWAHFEDAFRSAAAIADTGWVFVETDGRAHGNPTRRQIIAKATEDLFRKMQSACPSCGSPGYAAVQSFPGLPCADCGNPTKIARAQLWLCRKCGEHETRETARQLADPIFCDYCNP